MDWKSLSFYTYLIKMNRIGVSSYFILNIMVIIDFSCLPYLVGCFTIGRDFFQDGNRFIEHCCIINHHQSAIGTRFEVYAYALSLLEVGSTEEIAYGLNFDIEFISNAMHTA